MLLGNGEKPGALCVVPVIRYALLWAFLFLPALAVNPERRISQYAHTAWRLQDGSFRGKPWAITQTTDGYVWIGTSSGIKRFDGVRFVPWVPPGGESLRTAAVPALGTTSDGGLWIGTSDQVLWEWNHQRLTSYPLAGWVRDIHSVRENGKESVWVALSNSRDTPGAMCEVSGRQVHCYGQSSGFPMHCCTAVSSDTAGFLWVGTDRAVVKWKPRSSIADTTEVTNGMADPIDIIGVAILPDGSAWAGVNQPGRTGGLQHLVQRTWKPFITPQWNGSRVAVQALLQDHHGTLWVGTAREGLYRVRRGGKVDHFGSAEGLSADYVSNIFEDREGNVWVATRMGIDCFRDLAVTTFSPHEGLSGTEIDGVLASRDGTVWAGGDGTLDLLREGRISSLRVGKGLPGSQVTSLFEDHAGRRWVGMDGTMSILKNGRFTPIKRRDGTPMGFVVGMAEDVDNNIWLETRGAPRELIQIRDLQVARIFPASEMPAARRVAADPKGGIWLGLMSGDLARYRNGKLDTFHFKHGSPEYVTDLMVNPDGSVLGATAIGLIAWRQGEQRTLTVRNGLPCDSINALVRDNAAALWMYTQCGLIQVSEQELQKWWSNESAVLQMRIFDSVDGVQAGFAPFQGAARAPDGKLWFANEGTLQMIDPPHLRANPIAPPVHIEEALADHHAFSPGTEIRFPPLTRDIAIRYTALSFVAPQKVRFRYMLEGQENTWQEAGTRREAFYTNLAPRNYRFRVIACNNDGLWNETGDTLNFSIAPAYYQTTWFRLLCASIVGCAFWLLYLLRLKHATDQIQQRMGGRLEERERIARELHDTLLQGFHGLMLRFQAVLKVLPEDVPAHQMMESALDRADGVLLEGRQRVRDLREAGLPGTELVHALTRCGEELSDGSSSRFSVSVEGTPLPLDRDLLNEAYRIAREALSNAFQHAQASQIEAELIYGSEQVCLRIRDDGTGIDSVILDAGKAGHWGLSGMRERAEKIGAKLNIWSHGGAGTEIELLIPATVAYSPTLKRSRWRQIGTGQRGRERGRTL